MVAFDGEVRTQYLVSVWLTDVDEPPIDLKADYPENEIERVAAFLGLDPEGEDVSWELSGDDAGAFRIEIQIFTIQPVGVSLPFGILDFRSPPDYEAPTDVGEDNIYHVTVRALDPQGHSAEFDRDRHENGPDCDVLHGRRKRGECELRRRHLAAAVGARPEGDETSRSR